MNNVSVAQWIEHSPPKNGVKRRLIERRGLFDNYLTRYTIYNWIHIQVQRDYITNFVDETFSICLDKVHPKSELLRSTSMMLKKKGYEVKYFNTLDFRNSMHHNPFEYIHSEKDILKLVTALIANTKGDGKPSDPFWEKTETLLYTALIGYIHYVCPMEEQNFTTLLDMLNSMEVREDDEDFLNAVDYQFEALKKKDPDNFAVRQYVKFKQAAGVATSI